MRREACPPQRGAPPHQPRSRCGEQLRDFAASWRGSAVAVTWHRRIHRVGAFVLSRAAGLIVVTAAVGYVLGQAFAGFWNARSFEGAGPD